MNLDEFKLYSKDVLELHKWITEILPRAQLCQECPDEKLITNETMFEWFVKKYETHRSLLNNANQFNNHNNVKLIDDSVQKLKTYGRIEDIENIANYLLQLKNETKNWSQTIIVNYQPPITTTKSIKFCAIL